MIHRVIVDNATGAILSTGVCQDADFDLVPEGTTAYVNHGDWRDDTHRLVDGEFVEIVKSDEEVVSEMWLSVRTIRDGRLKSSDWTQMPDSPLTSDQRSEWQMYRQQLRDLTDDYSHATSGDQVVFPEPPA